MTTTSPVSVALCTYDGAQFLDEQLASIAAQTALPHELVIFDDCSTDATMAIVRRFAATAPFTVRVSENPGNLGSRANFAECIAACTGELIVLCDQDDIWRPQKLNRLAGALCDEPEAAFAFSNAALIDEHRRPIPFSLWQAIRLSRAELRRFQSRRGFDVLLKRQVVTGATMAFRATYRDLLLPIPAGWIHDAWIALLLSGVAWGVAIDESLIEYRQHPRQQVGERRRSIYQQYLAARDKTPAEFQRMADAIRAARDRLHERASSAVAAVEALDEKLRHAERRAHLHAHRHLRWPLVVNEWLAGNYSRYSPGWRALAQDLFL